MASGDYRPIYLHFRWCDPVGKDCGADAGAYLGRTPNLWVAGDHRRKVDTACTCKTGAESYALGAPPVLQAEEKLDFFRAEFFTVQRTNHCFDWEKWCREDQLGHGADGTLETSKSRGNALRQESAAEPYGTTPTIRARNFLQTASRKNCCFIQTTLRNGWSGPEHC